jgi:hypothetical protein
VKAFGSFLSAGFQSSGGKVIRQNRGAGSENSSPTSVLPSLNCPIQTTAHSCSSLLFWLMMRICWPCREWHSDAREASVGVDYDRFCDLVVK